MPQDKRADQYIDKLLAERQKALASQPKPEVPPEQKELLDDLGIDEEEPFVVELINKYGKIPTDILDEMSRRKARWGF